MKHSSIIMVMGVAGSGKTTIGRMLAGKLGVPFYDGDDYHPAENRSKMQAGIPLNDDDRYGWLQHLHALAVEAIAQKGAVIACSALKESYRRLLMQDIVPHVKWIHLSGEYDLIKERMQQRRGHFMPVGLLASQFDTLESPAYATTVSINEGPETVISQIMNTLDKSSIGIIGLGVMGRGLALNFADKGFRLSLYNRHVAGKEEHVARDLIQMNTELRAAQGFDDLPAFVASLETPRKILLMVEAGRVVDSVLDELLPLLSKGDIIADCGNSHYGDTQRRIVSLQKNDLNFLGVGVSGGAEGARYGPSIMPGGSRNGYAHIASSLESLAARDKGDHPCCSYIGDGGAGHFVKMVHNGIEYAEMQLIAEVYGLMRHGYGFDPDQIAHIFAEWHAGIHQSYLLGVTLEILGKREGDNWLLDQIADAAKSKGTGGWTIQAANELGFPSPVIAAAVDARSLSAQKEERKRSTDLYRSGHSRPALFDADHISNAFYLARLINHHLGFALLQKASATYQWYLQLNEVARIWTNGCIIRSSLMEQLRETLPEYILLHPTIQTQVETFRPALIDLIITGATHSITLPCHSAAMNYLNGYTIQQPTGNLIQAQRDFFGAHGFERNDDLSGKVYHL